MGKRMTISAVAAAAGVVAVSVFAVGGSWAESEVPAVDPELGIMALTQQASDKLPNVVAGSQDMKDLQTESSRALKSDDGNGYWVVRNNQQEICFVARTSDDVAGTTCADPRTFNSTGLAIQVISENFGAEAYLVPDEATGGSNLVTVSPFDENKEATVTKKLGKDNIEAAKLSIRTLPTPDFVPNGLKQQSSGN